MPNYKLTYFNFGGAAEKVRLAFVLAGIDFEDHRISADEWKELKPTAKFGQIPLLSIDGEVIAQSGAMLRHVGRLGNGSLYPRDAAAELKIEEVIGLAGDFDRAFYPSFGLSMRPLDFGFASDFPKTTQGAEQIRTTRTFFATETLPVYLRYYTQLLEETGAFFCGSEPTIADCYILPQLKNLLRGHIDHVPTTVLEPFPVVTAWIDRMMAIPAVAAWYAGH